MMIVRRVFLLLSSAAGVWGGFAALDYAARQAGADFDFHVTQESLPLLMSISLAGALIGAFLAGLVFPARR